MTGLERRYRQLFRAYPPEHRRRREDEMVAALLDASAPGQRWPAPREAVAILANGWRVRASSATEWQHGLAIAAVAATACASAMAAALLGLAFLAPFDPAAGPVRQVWRPAVAWALAAAAVVAVALVRRWTSALAVAAAVVLVAGVGADLVGARRAVALPFACFVLIAAAGRAVGRPSWPVRAAALGTGAVAGAGLLLRLSRQLDHWSRWSGGDPWRYADRWSYAGWMFDLPDEVWWVLVAAALVAGLAHPRFAVAGALLCIPLLPITIGGSGSGLGPDAAGRLVAVVVVLIGAALARGWASYRPAPATAPSPDAGEP